MSNCKNPGCPCVCDDPDMHHDLARLGGGTEVDPSCCARAEPTAPASDLQRALAERDSLRDQAETMAEDLRRARLRSCQCGEDEACAFARERDEARAESADLRARLEATEKERDQARSERQREYEARVTARGSVEAWEDYHTAEVRRAVEEETERIVRLLRAQASRWESDTPVRHALEVAASAILAQGKGAEK